MGISNAIPSTTDASAPLVTPSSIASALRVELREIELREQLCTEFKRSLGLSRTTARVLAARGITSVDQARAYLYPTLRDHLPDPQQIKNIVQAAELILSCVRDNSCITIYSDFDVDGLTSGAQLNLFLTALGAKVDNFVPNRFVEGYGLVSSAVEKLKRAGTELLITVDCGITNCAPIALAKRLGMRVVVVDHHQPGPELPPADVIVDPAQDGCPFQEHKLAAAGLVWMLLVVMRAVARAQNPNAAVPDPKDFLDLAAIGTICDMVPLTGVNRLLASRGIEALKHQTRVGVEALKNVAGINGSNRFGSGQISFALGPRINAAGRLDDANQVVTLLTTKDTFKAKSVAEAIDRLNSKRREIEGTVRDSCLAILRQNDALLLEPAIAIYDKEYHAGVIGIAAQRLVEEFNRPAAVMAPGEMIHHGELRQVAKGSVRSIKGFNVAEVLQSLGHLLLAHGGHESAGGFSLAFENLETFKQGFVDAARAILTPEMLTRRVLADLKIGLSEVDFELASELARLQPFGIGNPSPVLISENVLVDSVSLLSDKHLRVRFADATCSRNAVGWNMHGNKLLRKGERVHVAYHVELNTYQGISAVQLIIKEVWQ